MLPSQDLALMPVKILMMGTNLAIVFFWDLILAASSRLMDLSSELSKMFSNWRYWFWSSDFRSSMLWCKVWFSFSIFDSKFWEFVCADSRVFRFDSDWACWDAASCACCSIASFRTSTAFLFLAFSLEIWSFSSFSDFLYCSLFFLWLTKVFCNSLTFSSRSPSLPIT